MEIETVNSNIRLLEELLDNFEANGATAEEMELCKELAANCDKFRPNLSKLATETDDKGDSLGLLNLASSFFDLFTKFFFIKIAEILTTSDQLSHVLDRYEVLVRTMREPIPVSQPQGAALDLLDLGPIVQPQLSPRSALDDQLLLGNLTRHKNCFSN